MSAALGATLPALTEKHFAQQVVDLAKIYGWRVYKTWLPIHSPSGFPDLVLVRTSGASRVGLIFAELKSAKGKTSPKQDEWLADLRTVAMWCAPYVEVHLWRPTDFDDIARVLAR